MEGVEFILLDIEGTVCSISFVKDVLFPYAVNALPDVLAAKWDAPDFEPYRKAFPAEYQHDPGALQAHVEDLTRRDVKIAYLKNLQGFLWEEGYRTGAYATSLFPDVVPALRQWKDSGRVLAIYSSGSVFAQKLLFGHVEVTETLASHKRGRLGVAEEGAKEANTPLPAQQLVAESGLVGEFAAAQGNEQPDASHHDRLQQVKTAVSAGTGHTPEHHPTSSDDRHPVDNNHDGTEVRQVVNLTGLFDGWFDTINAGLKTNSSSYTQIANALQCEVDRILFLSDNVKEVDAALEAGMKSIVVDRPGNAPLPEDTKGRLQVVDSLSQIALRGGEGRNQ